MSLRSFFNLIFQFIMIVYEVCICIVVYTYHVLCVQYAYVCVVYTYYVLCVWYVYLCGAYIPWHMWRLSLSPRWHLGIEFRSVSLKVLLPTEPSHEFRSNSFHTCLHELNQPYPYNKVGVPFMTWKFLPRKTSGRSKPGLMQGSISGFTSFLLHLP